MMAGQWFITSICWAMLLMHVSAALQCSAKTDRIHKLMHGVADPYDFCSFWQSYRKIRKVSPFGNLDAPAVSDICNCVAATPSLVGGIPPASTGSVGEVKCHRRNPAILAFKQAVADPSTFCSFWGTAGGRSQSPFPNIGSHKVNNICNCFRAKPYIFAPPSSSTISSATATFASSNSSVPFPTTMSTLNSSTTTSQNISLATITVTAFETGNTPYTATGTVISANTTEVVVTVFTPLPTVTTTLIGSSSIPYTETVTVSATEVIVSVFLGSVANTFTTFGTASTPYTSSATFLSDGVEQIDVTVFEPLPTITQFTTITSGSVAATEISTTTDGTAIEVLQTIIEPLPTITKITTITSGTQSFGVEEIIETNGTVEVLETFFVPLPTITEATTITFGSVATTALTTITNSNTVEILETVIDPLPTITEATTITIGNMDTTEVGTITSSNTVMVLETIVVALPTVTEITTITIGSIDTTQFATITTSNEIEILETVITALPTITEITTITLGNIGYTEIATVTNGNVVEVLQEVVVPLTLTETSYYTGPATGTFTVTEAPSGTQPAEVIIEAPTCTPGLQFAYYAMQQSSSGYSYAGNIPTYPVSQGGYIPGLFEASNIIGQQSPNLIGSTTVVGFYGWGGSSSATQPIYGSTNSYQIPYALIQHIGYFNPTQTGTYTFAFANMDDAGLLWLGSTAISGFSDSNAILVDVLSQSASVEYSAIAGSYIPIRMMAVNAQQGWSCGFQITAPDGSTVVRGGINANQPVVGNQLVFGCPSSIATPFSF